MAQSKDQTICLAASAELSERQADILAPWSRKRRACSHPEMPTLSTWLPLAF